MISQDHPFDFLKTLFQGEAIFSFSRYVYTPDSLFDTREKFQIAGKEITKERINAEIASLRQDQELAIHSNVQINGRNYHIPMIDFSTEGDVASGLYDRLGQYLPRKVIMNMALYASGRSFHGYSTTLLGQREWIDFMGRLLLVNPRNQPDIVDSRWVGHRLVGGFGSLRWSNSSGQYCGLPIRVRFP